MTRPKKQWCTLGGCTIRSPAPVTGDQGGHVPMRTPRRFDPVCWQRRERIRCETSLCRTGPPPAWMEELACIDRSCLFLFATPIPSASTACSPLCTPIFLSVRVVCSLSYRLRVAAESRVDDTSSADVSVKGSATIFVLMKDFFLFVNQQNFCNLDLTDSKKCQLATQQQKHTGTDACKTTATPAQQWSFYGHLMAFLANLTMSGDASM